MKKLNKLIVAMVIIFASLLITPIVVTNTQTAYTVEAASKIQLNKTKKTLYVGDTYKLKITGTNKKVKWSTSDKSIATVNANGKIKAKKKGNVTIKAKVGGKTYKCKIKVKNNYVKAGKYKLTFGTYKSKYSVFTYTIKKDGTYTKKGYSDGTKETGVYKIEKCSTKEYGKKYKNYYLIQLFDQTGSNLLYEFFINKNNQFSEELQMSADVYKLKK